MPFYLQGPTEQDRIQILLSHQPSSEEHKLSTRRRHEVVKKLMAHGLDLQNWAHGAAEHITTRSVPRFIIGGDLNTTAPALKLLAAYFTLEPIETATSKANLAECKHGDIAIGVNVSFIHTDCMVQNRDPQRDIVLTRSPWPSTLPANFHAQQTPEVHAYWNYDFSRFRKPRCWTLLRGCSCGKKTFSGSCKTETCSANTMPPVRDMAAQPRPGFSECLFTAFI